MVMLIKGVVCCCPCRQLSQLTDWWQKRVCVYELIYHVCSLHNLFLGMEGEGRFPMPSSAQPPLHLPSVHLGVFALGSPTNQLVVGGLGWSSGPPPSPSGLPVRGPPLCYPEVTEHTPHELPHLRLITLTNRAGPSTHSTAGE